MTVGQVEYAERQARNEFDRWNDVTGQFGIATSYYEEMQSVLEDAVHIGIQMALYGKVLRTKDGEIQKTILDLQSTKQ